MLSFFEEKFLFDMELLFLNKVIECFHFLFAELVALGDNFSHEFRRNEMQIDLLFEHFY